MPWTGTRAATDEEYHTTAATFIVYSLLRCGLVSTGTQTLSHAADLLPYKRNKDIAEAADSEAKYFRVSPSLKRTEAQGSPYITQPTRVLPTTGDLARQP